MKSARNSPAEDPIRIVHMASCARSGETLMLRMLAAHPEIHVAFDLKAENDPAERSAQSFLMQCRNTEIERDHPALGGRVPPEARILLVKQGVWEHRAPFNGFVLARNPVSVVASLLEYDAKQAPSQSALRHLAANVRRRVGRLSGRQASVPNAQPRWERLLRWQNAIDPQLTPFLREMPYADAVCAFYNRRMMPLAELGLPVFCYERLVVDPQGEMTALLSYLGLKMQSQLLTSHESYATSPSGHGKTDLSRPISTASLDGWRTRIDREMFHRIAGFSYPAWSALGYNLSWEKIVPPPRP